jgi:hypothetical protein
MWLTIGKESSRKERVKGGVYNRVLGREGGRYFWSKTMGGGVRKLDVTKQKTKHSNEEENLFKLIF